jgi:hypothetical protein
MTIGPAYVSAAVDHQQPMGPRGRYSTQAVPRLTGDNLGRFRPLTE